MYVRHKYTNYQWLHQWLKNFSSRILWQGSVNQRLGCLEVGLLPNRRGFESRSEQDFGLCWVEVICETKSLFFFRKALLLCCFPQLSVFFTFYFSIHIDSFPRNMHCLWTFIRNMLFSARSILSLPCLNPFLNPRILLPLVLSIATSSPSELCTF